MSTNSLIYVMLFVCSGIGGWMPTLWGAGYLSGSSLLGSTLGGLVGILIGYKLGKSYLQ